MNTIKRVIKEEYLSLGDLKRQTKAEYPPILIDELEKSGLRCVKCSSGGNFKLLRNSDGEIHICWYKYGLCKVLINNSLDRAKFTDQFLIDIETRVLKETAPTSFFDTYIHAECGGS